MFCVSSSHHFQRLHLVVIVSEFEVGCETYISWMFFSVATVTSYTMFLLVHFPDNEWPGRYVPAFNLCILILTIMNITKLVPCIAFYRQVICYKFGYLHLMWELLPVVVMHFLAVLRKRFVVLKLRILCWICFYVGMPKCWCVVLLLRTSLTPIPSLLRH